MEKKKIRSSVRYSPSMHMYTNIGTRALYYYGLCSADDDDIDRQNAATDHVIIYYMPSSCTVLLPPLLLLLLQCSRALSSPRNRDQDVYGLLFIYILIFFLPSSAPARAFWYIAGAHHYPPYETNYGRGTLKYNIGVCT